MFLLKSGNNVQVTPVVPPDDDKPSRGRGPLTTTTSEVADSYSCRDTHEGASDVVPSFLYSCP